MTKSNSTLGWSASNQDRWLLWYNSQDADLKTGTFGFAVKANHSGITDWNGKLSTASFTIRYDLINPENDEVIESREFWKNGVANLPN